MTMSDVRFPVTIDSDGSPNRVASAPPSMERHVKDLDHDLDLQFSRHRRQQSTGSTCKAFYLCSRLPSALGNDNIASYRRSCFRFGSGAHALGTEDITRVSHLPIKRNVTIRHPRTHSPWGVSVRQFLSSCAYERQTPG